MTINVIVQYNDRSLPDSFLLTQAPIIVVWFDGTTILRKIRTHPLDLLSIPRLGRKNVKTFRWDQRLQIQNLFIAFERVPRWK